MRELTINEVESVAGGTAGGMLDGAIMVAGGVALIASVPVGAPAIVAIAAGVFAMASVQRGFYTVIINRS